MTTTRKCDACGTPNSGAIHFVDGKGLCQECVDKLVTREAYMSGRITHDAYYLAIASILGLDAIERLVEPVIRGYTLESAGEHLNGIPLRQWDQLDYAVRRMVAEKPAAVMAASWGGAPFAPGRYCWSLSETVCTTKAVARRMLEGKAKS